LPNIQSVKYVKRNDVRLKTGKSEEFNKILLQFLGSLEGKVKGLKGFVVLNRTSDENEMMVLTLWETEYDMEIFIIHPIGHLVSLLTEHHRYLRANQKGLITRYHHSEFNLPWYSFPLFSSELSGSHLASLFFLFSS
jgi:heme-degrading monooxygenase HmoA